MAKIKVVRSEGNSLVLTVTDLIPKNWTVVTTEITEKNDNSITVKIEKVNQ